MFPELTRIPRLMLRMLLPAASDGVVGSEVIVRIRPQLGCRDDHRRPENVRAITDSPLTAIVAFRLDGCEFLRQSFDDELLQ